MNSERWRKIEELYEAAQDRAPGERIAFLADACPGDDELRREIEAMLAQDADRNILDSPASDLLAEAAKSLSAGDKLGPYEIVVVIGAGGMGEVYKARDPRLRRNVAVKVLPSEVSRDPSRRQRFEREARAVAALNHPNIVAIHDVGEERGVYFIVTELVDGEPLRATGLNVRKALDIAVQIASGLAAAHRVGVVHRDLKPANILLDRDGHIKILDFGLAKLGPNGTDGNQETATLHTHPGVVMGTPGYMSPEQVQGQPTDHRTDIFTFGLILYELLAGQRAFHGTAAEAMSAILRDEPKPVSQIATGIPLELERIIARCLRKDPERRFQNMSDVRVALLELKEESESGRLPETAAAPARKRARLWVSIASTVLALLGTGLWVAKRRTATLPQESLVQVTSYPGSEIYPSFSPDGKQVAFSWNGEKADRFSIYVTLLGETNALRLTTSPTADTYPAWAPDGKRIAFRRAGPNGGIYTVSALGGPERKLSGLPGTMQMSWSPNGQWLAMAAGTVPDFAILLLPVDGGEPRRVSNPKPPNRDWAPAFAPDGRRLAYSHCTPSALCDVYVQELGSRYLPQGSSRQVTRQRDVIADLTWTRDGGSLIYSASHSSGTLSHLWRIDLNGGQASHRLEVAGPDAYSPSASPTANRLLFSRHRMDFDIWRYRVNAGTEPVVVSSLNDINPQFSPDGSRIVFQSSRSGDAEEIWMVQADGSNPVQMTNRLGRHHGSPRWSPDGGSIAFDSQNEDGNWGIYVMDASGGTPRRIRIEPSDGLMPSWSRDGKSLYFQSSRSGRHEIWRVPLAGGPPEQVTKSGAFVAYESADGQTLFYTRNSLAGPVFAMPLPKGEERQVLPYTLGREFFPVAEGIYYIGRRNDDKTYPLEFFQFSDNTSRLLAKIDGQVGIGLSVSPDQKTILFSKAASVGADLMMIENFQ